MVDIGTEPLEQVHVAALPIDALHRLLDRDEGRRLDDSIARARKLLAGRVVWNVNSTAAGGGVAEMLRSLLGYVQSAGIDARWYVIHGDATFFQVTKRLHKF